ncbi:hypothetical protein STIAU_7300, partial [Stigmatella aurantiaca DW4/3-1]
SASGAELPCLGLAQMCVSPR